MNAGEVPNFQTQSDKDDIAIFADYFTLLDQIDKRLQKEDPEYKKMYYPEEKSNAN